MDRNASLSCWLKEDKGTSRRRVNRGRGSRSSQGTESVEHGEFRERWEGDKDGLGQFEAV